MIYKIFVSMFERRFMATETVVRAILKLFDRFVSIPQQSKLPAAEKPFFRFSKDEEINE